VLLVCTGAAAAGCVSRLPEASPFAPVVSIDQGALQGVALEGVERFLNIPYAAAPTGEMRWRPPAPANAWRGVREAGSYGPACPQPVRPAVVAGGVAENQSEDCLQLNIWRPEGARNLPVIVWIHGGAHVIGSSVFPLFDGERLARQGVVFVSINYRLGVLGYFAHPSLTVETDTAAPLGNYGFMDQMAALRWIQENIAAFGGDPARVTVMGESAGANSIIALLANPQARGLFSKAIIQSSVALADYRSLEQQESAGRALALRAGLSEGADAGALRSLSVDAILAAQGERSGGEIGPFIDGRAITDTPWRVVARGEAIDIPLLIGANSDEASVIFAMGVPAAAAKAYIGPDIDAARAAYGVELSEAEFARQVLGDAWFVAPARWLAGQTSDGAASFLYHFDYVAAARRGARPGAAHGSELPYIFQTLDQFSAVLGPRTEEDLTFARDISACWIAFAATGEPNCPLAPDWPVYDAKRDALALIGDESRIVDGFRKSQIDLLLRQYAAKR
jgi:para-nitrobenzyl esterase